MKQLTCEMCGSTDLLKQDGVFVCQTCGTKYSIEEAKKMMVEGTVDVQGTVKVDSSDRLAKLLLLAKQARMENNTEEAVKYYELARQEDPTNWESNFFTSYYSLLQGTVATLSTAFPNFTNRVKTSVNILLANGEEQAEKLNEIFVYTINVYNTVIVAVMKRHGDMSTEMMKNAIADALRGNSGSNYIEMQRKLDQKARDEAQKKEHRELFLLTANLRISLGELCVVDEKHPGLVKPETMKSLYETWDASFQADVEDILGWKTNPYQEFTKELYMYEHFRQGKDPSYRSKALEKLRESVAKDPTSGETVTWMRTTIKTLDEENNKNRIKKYWAEHAEEKAELEAKKAELQEKCAALRKERDTVPGQNEVTELSNQIHSLTVELGSLGIFKMKEKKALQEQIAGLSDQRQKKQNEINAHKAKFDAEIKAIQNEISQIESKLSNPT